jgi:TonB family protein
MRLIATLVSTIVLLSARPIGVAAPEPDFGHAPLIGPGDMVKMTKPDWPYEARSRERGGAIVLGFVIGADGAPQNIRVLATTAPPLTTEAAIAWLRSCRANPARHGKILRTVIQFKR